MAKRGADIELGRAAADRRPAEDFAPREADPRRASRAQLLMAAVIYAAWLAFLATVALR